MADKKITLKPGEKLTVSIRRKSEQKKLKKAIAGITQASGIMKTRRADDYLPRRIKPSGIKFFDFGQIPTGGGFSDWDFHLISDYPFNGDRPEFTTENIADYNEPLLAENAFTTHARQILRAHSRVFNGVFVFFDELGEQISTIFTNSERFDTGTFILTEEENAAAVVLFVWSASHPDDDFVLNSGSLQPEGEYTILILKGDSGDDQKVTTLPEYESEAVIFSLAKNDSVYFAPRLEMAQAEFNDVGASYLLNWFYRIFPRSIFLDSTDYADHRTYTAGAVHTGMDAERLERFNQGVEIHKLSPHARAYRLTTSDDPVLLPASGFPPSGYDNPTSTLRTFNSTMASYTPISREGMLMAIVVRGTQKFYFWKTAATQF